MARDTQGRTVRPLGRGRAAETPPPVPSPRSPRRLECKCRRGSRNLSSSRDRFLFLQFSVGQPVLPQSQMPLPGSVCPANEVSGRKGGGSVRGEEEADGKGWGAGGGGESLGSVTPGPAAGPAQTLGPGGDESPLLRPSHDR